MPAQPTIVLVHGAFADASGWGGVITRLLADIYTVYAPPNPLRGIAGDAAYIQDFVGTIDGPVVLVGHSYGGAVISNVHADNVVALVYVAAFALDEGESVQQALEIAGDEVDFTQVIVIRPYPGAPEGDGDGYLKPEIFHQTFCQDLSPEQGFVMAASQRPAALSSLATPSGPPSWRGTPSRDVVGTPHPPIPPPPAPAQARPPR